MADTSRSASGDESLHNDVVAVLKEELKKARKDSYDYWLKMRHAQVQSEALALQLNQHISGSLSQEHKLITAFLNVFVVIHQIYKEGDSIHLIDLHRCVEEAFKGENVPIPQSLLHGLASPPDE